MNSPKVGMGLKQNNTSFSSDNIDVLAGYNMVNIQKPCVIMILVTDYDYIYNIINYTIAITVHLEMVIMII